jgi:hypothetical protein
MRGRYCLPLPPRVPLFTVVGRPIATGGPLPRDDPGFDAAVERVHGLVLGQVVQLFDKYKGLAGQGDRDIRIV